MIVAACRQPNDVFVTEAFNTQPARPVQQFEGFYVSAPGVSSFVTCAMGEMPGAGKGYWLIPDEAFTRSYEHPEGITLGDIGGTYGPYDEFAIYVRFEGMLVAEAGERYGYAGLYSGEIMVTRTLEASRRWVGSSRPQRRFRGC